MKNKLKLTVISLCMLMTMPVIAQEEKEDTGMPVSESLQIIQDSQNSKAKQSAKEDSIQRIYDKSDVPKMDSWQKWG